MNNNPLSIIDALSMIVAEKEPTNGHRCCQVTLNIPWEVAEEVNIALAPFISNISNVIEFRSYQKKQFDKGKAIRQEEYKRREICARKKMYYSIKDIHKKGISFGTFCKAVNNSAGYYSLRCIGIRQHDVNRIYYRVRAWSIKHRYDRKDSADEICKAFNIAKPTLYSILRRVKKKPRENVGGSSTK